MSKYDYIYTYGGKEYSFFELSDLIMHQCQLKENKKGFFKAHILGRYSFQTGFIEGILIGTELMKLYNPQIKLRKKSKQKEVGK